MKNEPTKGEPIKAEIMKNEPIKEKSTENESIKGESMENEFTKRELTKGEIAESETIKEGTIKGETMKGEVMKSETIKKINTFGKVGRIICTIGKVAMMITTIVFLLLFFLINLLPTESIKLELTSDNSAKFTVSDNMQWLDLDLNEGGGTIKIGNDTYQIMDGDGLPLSIKKTIRFADLKWVVILAISSTVASYICLRFGGKLCKEIQNCETPFTEAVAACITKLAWGLVALLAIETISMPIVEMLLGLTNDFSINIDLLSVLLILCVFMLSFVFKHGITLQTESDETL